MNIDSDLFSVQPLSGPTGKVFTMKITNFEKTIIQKMIYVIKTKKLVKKRSYNYNEFVFLVSDYLNIQMADNTDIYKNLFYKVIRFNDQVKRELFKNIIKYPKDRDMFIKYIKHLSQTSNKNDFMLYLKNKIEKEFSKESLGNDIKNHESFNKDFRKLIIKGYFQ